MKTPQPWYNNLLGSGTNIFGAGTDIDMERNKKLGLLQKSDVDTARNASLTKGLIGSVVGYLAQPKKQNYDSGLPYIFKGLQQGMKSAQQPFDDLKDKASANLKLDELIDKQETKKFADADVADFIKRNPEYNGIQNLENRDAIIAKAMEQLGTYKYKGKDGSDWKYEEQEIMAEMEKLRAEGITDPVKLKAMAFENVRARKNPPKELSAYDTAIGAKGAERDIKLIEGAEMAVGQIAKLDRAMQLVRDPNTTVGQFANEFLAIDKAKYLVGVGDKAQLSDKISTTEVLDAMLGSDVFPMIKQLGIGARGLDTPAEREFLQKVMTGAIPMNRDTLTKLTIMRRNNFVEMAKRYNEKYDGKGWERLKNSEIGNQLKRMEYNEGKDSAFVQNMFRDHPVTGKEQVIQLHADGSMWDANTGERIEDSSYDIYDKRNNFNLPADKVGNRYGITYSETPVGQNGTSSTEFPKGTN